MEKVLPILRMVEEQRKASPHSEFPKTTTSEISLSTPIIPDAQVESPESVDSSTEHRLKGDHNAVPSSSVVEKKLRDRKSPLVISSTCLDSGVDEQDIARGPIPSASKEVSPNGVVRKEVAYEVKQSDYQGVS